MQPRAADFQGNRRFEVLARLGAGATGVVYAAHDRESDARVALKVLRHVAPESVAEFKQEFRAISDLAHPNLVRLGELLSDGGRWLFTMELVEGVDFYSFVRPDGVLDTERLRDALIQLVSALHALHNTGQVHRDVKPSNVLVGEDGRLKLLDFGLATRVAPETTESADRAVGTTAYVAPEQVSGRALGPATDFYAMGVMLYEALAGRLPFEGPPLKVLMDKQTLRVRAPSERAAWVDQDLEALCLELLSTDPAARPGTERILAKLRGRRSLPPISQLTRSPAFFGRERELEELLRACAVRSSRPRVLLITGASGAGKSALLARVGRKLAGSGSLVFTGRCRAADTGAYAALHGLLGDLAQHLSRMKSDQLSGALPRHAGLLACAFPAFSHVTAVARAQLEAEQVRNPAELRERSFIALRELLRGLARHRPLVLCLDDLHLADEDSLCVLDALLGPDAPALTVIASVHHMPSLPALHRRLPLAGEPFALAGLEREAGASLARHALELDAPAHAARAAELAARVSHWPRAIEELALVLREGAAIPIDPDVRALIGARLALLEPAARRVLSLLAVSIAPLSLEALRYASALEREELGRIVSRLRIARLVRPVGSHEKEYVELLHEDLRAALLACASSDELRGLHQGLAVALETARSDAVEALSRHWHAAGSLERAAEHAAKAADRALDSLAFARAAQLYRTAVEWGATSPELHVRHADALACAGRGPDAARAYLAAAGDRTTPDALELRRRAAEQLLVCGLAHEGQRAAHPLLDELSLGLAASRPWGVLRARARGLRIELFGIHFQSRDTSEIPARSLLRVDACWSMALGLAAVAPARAPDALTLHLNLALSAGEPYRVGRALAALSILCCMIRGRATHAQELSERAEAIAERQGEPHLAALCQLSAGLRAFHAGDLDAAKAGIELSERTLREGCSGATWELGTAQFFSLLCRLAAGEVRSLDRHASRAYDDALARGDQHAASRLRLRVLPSVALLAGDLQRARAQLAAGSGELRSSAPVIEEFWRALAAIECELYARDPRAALASMRKLWPQIERARLLSLRMPYLSAYWLRARVTLAALAAGVRQARPEAVLHDAALLEASETGGGLGFGLALRATLAERAGELATARAAWARAEALLRGDGLALLAQCARLRRGHLSQGAEAERTRRDAEVWLAGAGVRDPVSVLAVYMPG